MNEPQRIPELLLMGINTSVGHELRQILESHGFAATTVSPEKISSGLTANLVIFELGSDAAVDHKNLNTLMTAFKHRPAVIALVKDSYEQRCRAYEMGADECVQLPIIKSELLARIKAGLGQRPGEITAEKNIDHDAILLSQVTSYLMERIGEGFKLRQLELKFGVNRNKLESVFKSAYGVPVFTWLREQRMKVAAHMFITTDKNINQIAYSVGYKDSNNFSTCFKRIYGKSPLHYRKLVRQSKHDAPLSKEIAAGVNFTEFAEPTQSLW